MSGYLAVKNLHVACALLSISGFILRGIWLRFSPARLGPVWVKILPHCVDTVLLLSAIYLALQLQQAPFLNHWLTAKVLALLLYLGLGMIALRFGRSEMQRLLAWLAAIVVFLYIIAIALTKNPTPFL